MYVNKSYTAAREDKYEDNCWSLLRDGDPIFCRTSLYLIKRMDLRALRELVLYIERPVRDLRFRSLSVGKRCGCMGNHLYSRCVDEEGSDDN